MRIEIDSALKEALPEAVLGVLTCTADVHPSSAEQNVEFDALIAAMAQKYATPADVTQNPQIKGTRAAYKILRKDPAKYRNSAEAMLRRIAKGTGLYKVNNAVDVNNMISIQSGWSLGSYDCAQISGAVVWKRTPDGEQYKGIGKDVLNIEHLPALYDDDGVFGNPTSDSRRTMISGGENKKLLYVVYAFSNGDAVPEFLKETARLLTKYANARDIETDIVQ